MNFSHIPLQNFKLFNQTFTWDIPTIKSSKLKLDNNVHYEVSPTLPLLLTFGLPNTQFVNLYNPVLESPQNSVLISNKSIRYLLTHIRFSSTSYMTSLIDIFSYEIKNSSSNLDYVNPHLTYSKNTLQIQTLGITYNDLFNDLFKWSSKFSYLYQLVLKSYDLRQSLKIYSFLVKTNSSNLITTQGILVYHFHQVTTSERIFIFTPLSVIGNGHLSKDFSFTNNSSQWGVSIAQLFSSARWLEREVSELFGIQLLGMLDRRNLLLQYGETSAPLKKSYPSVG